MLAIVDYQMGNLRSVQKALEKMGHQATVTDDPADLERADKIVLPGVGAFQDAIDQLRRRDLVEPILRAIDAGKPFLGICLGLQLLLDVSYEDGRHEGLGVIPGSVVRFELPDGYKVPHMGWNEVTFRGPLAITTGIDNPTHFYFVHSYYAVPEDESVVAGTADYGEPFCAAIHRDNVFATQFHPEKSQRAGLQMLKNFAEMGS